MLKIILKSANVSRSYSKSYTGTVFLDTVDSVVILNVKKYVNRAYLNSFDTVRLKRRLTPTPPLLFHISK